MLRSIGRFKFVRGTQERGAHTRSNQSINPSINQSIFEARKAVDYRHRTAEQTHAIHRWI
eukprot:jgi/Psemu1/300770/fgenesh1_kg.18_\